MTATASNPNLKIALLGGEGLRSQSAPLWQALLSLAGVDQPHIALIPVAVSSLPLSQSERRTQITRSQLSEFGFTTSLITPTPDADPPSLNGTKMVYLPGGDQRAVVQSLQNTPLWNMITSSTSAVNLLIASGGAAVALGDRAFEPIKPYPAALDAL